MRLGNALLDEFSEAGISLPNTPEWTMRRSYLLMELENELSDL